MALKTRSKPTCMKEEKRIGRVRHEEKSEKASTYSE